MPAPGLRQVDRGVAAEVVAVRRSPAAPSRACPSRARTGCRPSEQKPSTDQVLTNMPRGFGSRARWVSRSAMWMPLTPRFCASRAHPARVCGSANVEPVSLRDVEQRLLHHPRHHAGIGAAAADRRDAARTAAAHVEHALAQRVVRALRDRGLGVGVEAGPRLAHRVDVEAVDVLAEIHQVGRRGVDREVDDHAAAGPAGEQRGEHLAVVLARDRELLELELALVEQARGRCRPGRSRRISSGRSRCGARAAAARRARSSRSRSSRSGRRTAACMAMAFGHAGQGVHIGTSEQSVKTSRGKREREPARAVAPVRKSGRPCGIAVAGRADQAARAVERAAA